MEIFPSFLQTFEYANENLQMRKNAFLVETTVGKPSTEL